eukprot:CAMPEP_0195510280 /NCGR_PEP_ID=MMETSP0794_2-20130614/2970_1 /TAXON_ID=515487 /ORGANISM="Stephanopyxis turris, Strain CCMP 815" /LENGTH=267 /DNA_ID=CAMNT_0040637667 /DNA_START=26 /DNA_END=829 /DNA_ORIENTATION=+
MAWASFLFLALVTSVKSTLGFTSCSPSLISTAVFNKLERSRCSSPLALHDMVADPVITDTFHSSSSLLLSLIKKTDPSEARGVFWFTFIASSGGLGIGAKQVPEILKDLDNIKALAGVGPTLGGEELKTSKIATLIYPVALSKKDVEKVIKSVPSCAKISAQGDSTSYMASGGYIDRADFSKALRGCNPLAIRAVFDALSEGKGSYASPTTIDAKLEDWRGKGGINAFAENLQSAISTKLSSYLALAFIFAIVADLCIENAIQGWFQ